jgi:hypothetical protein
VILRNIVSRLSTRRAKTFVLQGEGFNILLDPSRDAVERRVQSLTYPGASYLQLTDRDGNYVQVLGGRPWCIIERGGIDPSSHRRAYQDTLSPKFPDGMKVNCGAGDYRALHDEWFLRKDAAAVMGAFLDSVAMPGFVRWRVRGLPAEER